MREKASEAAGSDIHPDALIGHVHLKVANLERGPITLGKGVWQFGILLMTICAFLIVAGIGNTSIYHSKLRVEMRRRKIDCSVARPLILRGMPHARLSPLDEP